MLVHYSSISWAQPAQPWEPAAPGPPRLTAMAHPRLGVCIPATTPTSSSSTMQGRYGAATGLSRRRSRPTRRRPSLMAMEHRQRCRVLQPTLQCRQGVPPTLHRRQVRLYRSMLSCNVEDGR